MKNFLWFAGALALAAMYFQPGHWAMLGGLILLIVAHEFGHWFVARALGFDVPTFSIGFGSNPRIVLGRFWGTQFQITPWLIGGYVKIDPSDANFQSKAIWKRGAVMVAGVTMNVLLAVALMFVLFVGFGQRDYAYQSVSISGVSTTVTIAADAGLRAGDEFVSVDGQTIATPQDLQRVLGAHKGVPASITVKRGADVLTYTVTPDKDGHIGIAIGGKVAPVYKKMGPLTAFTEAVKFNANLLKQMFVGLGMMLKIVPPPAGAPEGATDMHGLVAIVQFGAMAFNDGLYSFLQMLVLISMNLAFFNILPIPMLDGGHVMFLGIEKLRGKPLARQTQVAVSNLFFLLLILLMVWGLFNDVFHPVNFK